MSLNSNVIIVGVGGCSRSGKTILVKELINQYLKIKGKNINFTDICDSIHLDTYANASKVMKNQVRTSYGNIYENWEFSGSLDWDNFYEDIKTKISEINTKIKNSSNINQKGILFVEGFLLFSPLMLNTSNEIKYLNLFDYYIFICLDKKLAKIRRMKTTTVPDDYFEEILWPEYIKNCSNYGEFLTFQKYKNGKKVLIIDGNKEYNPNIMALCILKWMNVFNDFKLIDQNIYNSLFTSFDIQKDLIKKSLSSN